MLVGFGMVLGAARGEQQTQAGQQQLGGGTIYRTYCGSCHGIAGKGDGPLAEHLRTRPPDLTQIARRNNGVFSADQVAAIIDGRKPISGHGGGDMPVWGDSFKQSAAGGDEATVKGRIDALVDHLRSIQEE
jgi:mono/diheme cytochrome c family protein